MSEQNHAPQVEEQPITEAELSELLQIRRDRLQKMKDEGRNPFEITTFDRNAAATEVVEKFAEYARNVWDCKEEDNWKAANYGIDATEEFFRDCGIPMKLSEVGIDESKFEAMAEDAVKFGGLQWAYVALNKQDVVEILRMSL